MPHKYIFLNAVQVSERKTTLPVIKSSFSLSQKIFLQLFNNMVRLGSVCNVSLSALQKEEIYV